MAPRTGSESLLDEMSLDQAEFTSFGQAPVGEPHRGRLNRTYMPIPIEAIAADSPFQTRLVTFDPDEIPEDAELQESVRRHGVLEPIYIERLQAELGAPSNYRLIAGHRRLAAARAVGLVHIPVLVANPEDDPQALNLAENTGHRELLPYEKAIALVERREQEPGLSLRKLAEATGLPFGTTSDLVAAYEKSPPALRKMFAEGVAARTIIELQPAFETLDESQQIEAGTALGKVSIGQAQTFRRLIGQGIEPAAAAASANGLSRPAPKREHGAGPKRKARTRPSAAAAKPSSTRQGGLDPDDAAGLEALCARTGLSPRRAKWLARQAFEVGADYEVLTFAAFFLARGGKTTGALALAGRAAADRRLAGAVRTHIRQLERARVLIERQEDPALAGFLGTVFFGA